MKDFLDELDNELGSMSMPSKKEASKPVESKKPQPSKSSAPKTE